MRYILIVFLIFLVIGCKSKNGQNVSNQQDSAKISVKSETVNGRRLKLIVPNGFNIDTFKTFDKSIGAEFEIITPKSDKFKDLNILLEKEILKYKNNLIASVNEMFKNDSSLRQTSLNSGFWVNPISIYSNDTLISYSFVISYYLASAPHPNTKYYSLNFNIKTHKQIKFSDYFSVKNSKDSAFLISTINHAINKKDIGVGKVYDIDFNMENDTISFNFSDYEIACYAEGIIQGKVNKEVLKKIIKNNYR
jgi:hypothetical protein